MPSDLILFDQLKTATVSVGRRLPGHVENFLARPDKPLRLAMTLQAPFHIEGRRLPHQRHLLDLAMAGRAADAFLNMNAVVEIGEAGQVMHPIPFERLAVR